MHGDNHFHTSAGSKKSQYICNNCIMHPSDLPDMYIHLNSRAAGPRAWVYILSKARGHVIQMIRKKYENVPWLQANSSWLATDHPSQYERAHWIHYTRFQVACKNENQKRDQTCDLWYEYFKLAMSLVNNLLAKPD